MTIEPAASPSPGIAIDLGPVQETMLITLWARAVESQRADAITRDPRAVEIYHAINYDFSRFARGWKSQVGVAVRDRVIDDGEGYRLHSASTAHRKRDRCWSCKGVIDATTGGTT